MITFFYGSISVLTKICCAVGFVVLIINLAIMSSIANHNLIADRAEAKHLWLGQLPTVDIISQRALMISSPKKVRTSAQSRGEHWRDIALPAKPPPVSLPVISDWEQFAHLLLGELNADANVFAVAFLVGWQQSEGCAYHNPLCRLSREREILRYSSAAEGARVVAAQLWLAHPGRPDSWQASYQQIVGALQDSASYTSARELAEDVAGELRVWCGGIALCGDSSSDPYPARVATRAELAEAKMSS